MLKMELSTKHYNSSKRNYLFILLIVVILLECFPEVIVSEKKIHVTHWYCYHCWIINYWFRCFTMYFPLQIIQVKPKYFENLMKCSLKIFGFSLNPNKTIILKISFSNNKITNDVRFFRIFI